MKLDFTIGKFTLESLTNGMYSSPLDLYREYIQNAVDSFDEAISKGIDKHSSFRVEISIDSSKKSISIKDNGCGIGKDVAVKTLLDIGNSSKNRSVSRGFRGIGRLAGLGYCAKLSFITSTINEPMKTVISFDTRLLKKLLISEGEASSSVKDVFEEIVSIKHLPEKSSSHYFEVILEEVDMSDKLVNPEIVEQYLVQHSPLPFNKEFKWQSLILSKIETLGFQIKDYRVFLEVDGICKELFKPYKNSFIADRVRKVEDYIQDISVVPFYRKDKLCAVLWYAQTNYYGTIIDNSLKGIRIRQGNILIGGKSTCSQFFRDERFNGWNIGELHVLDSDLIINSRRDDFEKNSSYYEFAELISDWSIGLTKVIRKKSYERSLSNEKRAVLESDKLEDTNELCSKDLELKGEYDEANLMKTSDSKFVAENDFYNKLSLILNQKKAQTKYSALNINERLTIEQRRVLERVFDLISQEFEKETAEKLIGVIAKKY